MLRKRGNQLLLKRRGTFSQALSGKIASSGGKEKLKVSIVVLYVSKSKLVGL